MILLTTDKLILTGYIPGPPTNVHVTSVTSRRALLNWEASRDQALVTEYKIRLSYVRSGVSSDPVVVSS